MLKLLVVGLAAALAIDLLRHGAWIMGIIAVGYVIERMIRAPRDTWT